MEREAYDRLVSELMEQYELEGVADLKAVVVVSFLQFAHHHNYMHASIIVTYKGIMTDQLTASLKEGKK